MRRLLFTTRFVHVGKGTIWIFLLDLLGNIGFAAACERHDKRSFAATDLNALGDGGGGTEEQKKREAKKQCFHLGPILFIP